VAVIYILMLHQSMKKKNQEFLRFKYWFCPVLFGTIKIIRMLKLQDKELNGT